MEGFSLALVSTISVSIFLALIGYLNILKLLPIAIGIIYGLFYIKSIKSKEVINLNILLVLVLIVVITIYFHSYTINAGRDNGGYLNTAIQISNTGHYFFSDNILETIPGFKVLENGLFTYGFLPGYPVYLSFFSTNIHYIYIANGILYFFILFYMYSITEKLTSKKNAIIFIVLFSTFYTSLWIIRNTFSEILMSFLIWFSIYLLLTEDSQKKRWSILPIALCTLVRVDAAIYFLSFSFVYIFINKGDIWRYRTLSIKIVLVLSIIFLSMFVLLNHGGYSIGHVNEAIYNVIDLTSPSKIDEPNIYDTYPYKTYLNIVLKSYFLIAYIPLLCILFLHLIMHHKSMPKESYMLLIIFLPAILFIFRPMITPDHPWFMRRFWTIHIPLLIMASIYILQKLPRSIRIYYIIILFISNIIMISPIIAFSDDYNSAQNMDDFIALFDDNSALIFPSVSQNNFANYIYAKHDMRATVEPAYWPWLGHYYPSDKLIIEPTNSFFSEDVDLYLISFIAPENINPKYRISKLFNNSDLEYTGNYEYSVRQLRPSCNYVSEYLEGTADIALIKSKCDDLPPSRIITINKTFYIYKVNRSLNI